MVTVAEIARNIGIPATTAREYVGRFRAFFPTRKVVGKRYPMHPESAEDIMRDIVKAYADNITTDEVTNLLKEKYPIAADVVDEDRPNRSSSNNHSNLPATGSDNQALEIISRMNNMQMQLMQKMTDVLDRNNQIMERMMKALDANPTLTAGPKIEKKEDTKETSESFMPIEMPKIEDQPPFDQPLVPKMSIEPKPAETKVVPEFIKNAPTPKKFIMPSREEMEKRKSKSWLSRMFGS